jgi:glyoxylase-like metal-dependent hydrolase (beta-lactamase superfamily II)
LVVERVEIVPGIHWIPKINGNVYLLVDKELTLIDTGLPHHTKRILSYITETLHRKPDELTTIVLTHFHIDHIGNASELREETGAKIAAYADEAAYIEGKKKMPTPHSLLMRAMGPFMRSRPVLVDILLQDKENIHGCLVVHTPGHTPGSIALLELQHKVLLCGDTIRTPNGTIQGPSEQYSLDLRQAQQSVDRLKTLDFDVLLSGHGDPVRPDAAAKVRSALP